MTYLPDYSSVNSITSLLKARQHTFNAATMFNRCFDVRYRQIWVTIVVVNTLQICGKLVIITWPDLELAGVWLLSKV